MQLFKQKKSLHNIFISFNKSDDQECTYLDRYSTQACLHYRLENNDILRHFYSFDIFEWESYVYLYLLSSNIVPQLSSENLTIIYHVKNLISLKTFLNKTKTNIYILFNELYRFINSFKTFYFIHGNLTIDNIFIDNDLFNKTNIIKFYIIDYSNSFIIKSNIKTPKYKRSSFIREYNTPIKYELLDLWDFYTVYFSLSIFYKKNKVLIEYLNKLLNEYISSEKIIQFNDYVEKYFSF